MADEERLKGDVPDKAREFFSDLRVSRGLPVSHIVGLAVALGFGVGFVALNAPFASVGPARGAWAHLLAGLLTAFTVLTILDLQSGSPAPHSLYHLVLQSRSDWLASLEGWVLLGGEIVATALLLRALAERVVSLLSPLPSWALAVAIVVSAVPIALVFALDGGRGRVKRGLIFAALAGVWACLALSLLNGGGPQGEPSARVQANIWSVAALALAEFWALETVLADSESLRRVYANLPKAVLATAALVPAVVAVALLASPMGEGAAWLFWARWGWVISGAVDCALLSGLAAWMLRLPLQLGLTMARHGFLPQIFARANDRLGTSAACLAVIITATVAAALLVPTPALGAGMAFAFGLAAIGINAASIIRYYGVGIRTSWLPFFPLVPGLGIAGMAFLMIFLSGWTWLAGAIWVGFGIGIYGLFGLHWRSQTQEGITIFREEEGRPRSKFRVLVPVANPKTARNLMELAVLLARPRGGDIVALQVVEAPPGISTASARKLARGKLDALKAASDAVEELGVSVHATTRVARRVDEGILDTVEEDGCDLIVMGWTQQARIVPGSLGKVLESVMREAPCSVLILRGKSPSELGTILVPVTKGAHSRKAVEMAGLLAQSGGAKVRALHVLSTTATAQEEAEARESLTRLLGRLDPHLVAEPRIVRADDVAQAIVDESAEDDLILMGTARESWLDRARFGQVPERLAESTDRPLILVKARSPLLRMWFQRVWDALYDLFPNLDAEETVALYRTLSNGAKGDVNYYVLIVLSAIIASLGLLANSAAVIIGAMLVAPLMIPILTLSLGIVLGEPRVLSRGLESTVKGVGAALVLSAFAALLFPSHQVTAEIMVRTRPTLLDLGVALASGAAGAYALARKEVAAALPGVAIAAALMPPICTAGIGLAQGSGTIMGGALLLFATNLIAITLSGALIFLLLGMRPKAQEEHQNWLRRGLTLSAVLLVVISVLLTVIMVQTERASARQRLLRGVLAEQMRQFPSARLISVDHMEHSDGVWHIEATVQCIEPPSAQHIEAISKALATAMRDPVEVKLRIALVQEVDSRYPATGTNR